MNTTASTTGREYLRVSVDTSGTGRSPAEQHADNARAAAALGVKLGEPYRDNGRSASAYATKIREDYARLVSDLASGTFGADLLILWESSRGSRKVGEWVALIELCAERGVKIYVTTHQRSYDPRNGRDRRSLLEDAVDSEYESSKISDRAKRAAAANAASGKPHGRTPYGYIRTYDPVTRRLVAQSPDPVRAPLVRELFARLQQGHSLRSIARDWAERGVVNQSGKPFTAAHLRSMAITRAYAGQREHTPGRKGRGTAPGGQPVEVVEGNWPALVPQTTWLAVQRLLTAPERRTSRPGRGVHLLSMIAVCGVCGGPLAARARDGRALYTCHTKSCVRVAQAELDTYAERAMLGYLARPDVYKALAATSADDPKLAAARDKVAEVEGELDDLAAQVGAGKLSATFATRSEPGILARLKAARAAEAALSTPNTLTGLIAPGKDVARRWKVMPMESKRAVARILLSPGLLGELRLLRTPVHGKTTAPVEARVEFRR
jgi:site-specific DNA recombinase